MATEKNLFDEREEAFEAEFAYKNKQAFTFGATANRRLAAWAAGELGLSVADSDDFITWAGELALEADAERRLMDRILSDLQKKDIDMTIGRLRIKYDYFLEEAQAGR